MENTFKIYSQSSYNDKFSLLLVQEGVKWVLGDYKYLEIGSYLGGSLLPHLKDPKCTSAISIDKRGIRQKDNRGIDFFYLNNTTERMLKELARYCSKEEMEKLECIEGETTTKSFAVNKPDLCFIDGEHTDYMAASDFSFCYAHMKQGVIIFHDMDLVYQAIKHVLEDIEGEFVAYSLPDSIFVVELGCPIHRYPALIEYQLSYGHLSPLNLLIKTQPYRDFYNFPVFSFIRNLWNLITLKSISK